MHSLRTLPAFVFCLVFGGCCAVASQGPAARADLMPEPVVLPSPGALVPVEAEPCRDVPDLLENVVHPAAANLTSYLGGDFVFYNLDRGEPAAAARGVAVVAIDVREMDSMGAVFNCRVVQHLSGASFSEQRATLVKDGKSHVSMPAARMGDEMEPEAFELVFRLDRSGTIEVFHAPPRE